MDDRGEDGLYWYLLSGEEVIDIPDNCVSVMQSAFTSDPTIPSVDYNIKNLIVAEGDIDTGLRYDIWSGADSSRFDMGFKFDRVRERRVEESISLVGVGSVSFSGPSSFPSEFQAGTYYSTAGSYRFRDIHYDFETNMFTATFDSRSEAGDYILGWSFRTFINSYSFELLLFYTIEFQVN